MTRITLVPPLSPPALTFVLPATPPYIKPGMPPLIEPLESRIAPAAVAMFTDVDGDMVKITASKGMSADLQIAAHVNGSGLLTLLDLSHATWQAEFEGASITIAGEPQKSRAFALGGTCTRRRSR